eukprot:m.26327 g.26327  ORF g.26327 m.26327 type:complete len:487 (+) comp5847_c0_seq1:2-1462(+)
MTVIVIWSKVTQHMGASSRLTWLGAGLFPVAAKRIQTQAIMVTSRGLASSHEAIVRNVLDESKMPKFQINPNEIHVETNPKNFYNLILHGIKTAKHQIVMSSLYLGTGPGEKELVTELTRRVGNSSNLKVDILLDANRGTRGSPDSVAMLHDAVQFENCKAWFYQTPDMTPILKRVLKPPFNETVGLQHTKIFVFDDTLLLTGANLSEDYFAQRQDRYIIIKDQMAANWYAGVVKLFSSISHGLDKTGKLLQPKSHPNNRKEFQTKILNHMDSIHDERKSSTALYPLIQLGLYGVHNKEDMLCELFDKLDATGHVDIASGYFNLSPRLREKVLTTKSSVSIVCASPNANGFLGAHGVKGHIPFGYTHLLSTFLNDIPSGHAITVSEYERLEWTFHAKGIWLRNNQAAPPFATVVGSSNFNHRSAERDLEAQALIITSDDTLMEQFEKEFELIDAHCNRVEKKDLSKDERNPSAAQRLAAEIISSFL